MGTIINIVCLLLDIAILACVLSLIAGTTISLFVKPIYRIIQKAKSR